MLAFRFDHECALFVMISELKISMALGALEVLQEGILIHEATRPLVPIDFLACGQSH